MTTPVENTPAGTPDRDIKVRLFLTMATVVSISTFAGFLFAPWRVATGLLLGGLLSLLNLHWMSNSIGAALRVASTGRRPHIKITQFVLRYFVVAAVIYAAYELKLVSLPAAIVGLCSFVAALFVEAFREFYLSIAHREEVS
jgi:hypothetical protein